MVSRTRPKDEPPQTSSSGHRRPGLLRAAHSELLGGVFVCISPESTHPLTLVQLPCHCSPALTRQVVAPWGAEPTAASKGQEMQEVIVRQR